MDLNQLIDNAVGALPRGRRGNPSAVPSFLRNISAEDLPGILTGAADAPGTRPLARIRHTHHLAARLLAEGRSLVEVGAMTGYTPARLGQLKNDPTFKDLMHHYKDQVEAKYLNVHERLAGLGIAVTEELMQRLDEAPEEFSNDELRNLAKDMLDRGGFGPQSTRNLNVKSQSLSVDLIAQIKQEETSRGVVRQIGADQPEGSGTILSLSSDPLVPALVDDLFPED